MTDRNHLLENRPVRLFVSYSHQDKTWFSRLKTLVRFRDASLPTRVWHDQELLAGCPWHADIQKELDRMDIFVCLVSHNFLGSDYVMDEELPRAEARHGAGEIEVVPILLEPFNLEEDIPFLNGLDPLPVYGRPWNTFNPRNNANVLIRDGVREAVRNVQTKWGIE